MTTATNPAICATILRQLGGNRFLAMTGAKDLLDLGNGFRCRIGRNSGRITHVEIVLDAATDTYTVRFFRVKNRGLDCETISAHELVYADSLGDVIYNATGLLTSL